KDCIIIDDIVDTAGTAAQAAKALKEQGARRVFCYGVHAVLSGPALSRIQESPIEELVCTDSVPLAAEARALRRVRQLSVAPLLAEAIRRIHNADSVSSLFV